MTTTRVLWTSNTGHTTCTACAGSYLSHAITARPRARTHTTPLDRWSRVTLADIVEWDSYRRFMDADVLPPMACDACGCRSDLDTSTLEETQ